MFSTYNVFNAPDFVSVLKVWAISVLLSGDGKSSHYKR